MMLIRNFRCLKGLILNYLENPAIPNDSMIHSQGALDKPKFCRNVSHTVLVLVAEEVRDGVQSANRVTMLMTFISALFSQLLIKNMFHYTYNHVMTQKILLSKNQTPKHLSL